MSSQYQSNYASNCIDDSSANMCHTIDSPQGWLVITVTGYSVNKVVVYNRNDCCQDRINDAKLIYSYDFASTFIVHQSSFGSTSSLVYTFDFSTTTYVRIQQTTSNAITLAEVALYYNSVKVPISG